MRPTKTEKSSIKLIECPRDAMQGLDYFVPSNLKITYINALLKVGFDSLDFGSFVSEKAIPQMRDTEFVLEHLQSEQSSTQLLAIIANLKGADRAIKFPQITYLGYPLSISETFQRRNTNASIAQSLITIAEIQNLCKKHNKQLVIYLSMGFGNPYGEVWNEEILLLRTQQVIDLGIKTIALSDTIGISKPASILSIYPSLQNNFPGVEFGLHLHSTPQQRTEKIEAAFKAGCTRIDTALKGYGGCPMADDHLTGNIATEDVISYMNKENIPLQLNWEAWLEATNIANKIFNI